MPILLILLCRSRRSRPCGRSCRSRLADPAWPIPLCRSCRSRHCGRSSRSRLADLADLATPEIGSTDLRPDGMDRGSIPDPVSSILQTDVYLQRWTTTRMMSYDKEHETGKDIPGQVTKMGESLFKTSTHPTACSLFFFLSYIPICTSTYRYGRPPRRD